MPDNCYSVRKIKISSKNNKKDSNFFSLISIEKLCELNQKSKMKCCEKLQMTKTVQTWDRFPNGSKIKF